MIIAIYYDGSYEFISKNSIESVMKYPTLTGLLDTEQKKEFNIKNNQWQEFVYRTE